MSLSCAFSQCPQPGIKICSRCQLERYCCKSHQKGDWTRHKSSCVPVPQSILNCLKEDLFLYQDPATKSVSFKARKVIEASNEIISSSISVRSDPKTDCKFSEDDELQCYCSLAGQFISATEASVQDTIYRAPVVAAPEKLVWIQFFFPRHLQLDITTGVISYSISERETLEMYEKAKADELVALNSFVNSGLKLLESQYGIKSSQDQFLPQPMPQDYRNLLIKSLVIAKTFGEWKYKWAADVEKNYESKFLEMGVSKMMFRHSCTPNCILQQNGNQTLAVAIRTIQPGEELTLSFNLQITSFYPFLERQSRLFDRFGFYCRCPECTTVLISIDGTSLRETLLQGGNFPPFPPSSKEEKESGREYEAFVIYTGLCKEMGVDDNNFEIPKQKTSHEVTEWRDRCENFIRQYKLPENYWMSHTLRLWSARMSLLAIENDQKLPKYDRSKLNLNERRMAHIYSAEIFRRNIMVNSELLLRLDVTKHFEFSNFYSICQGRGMPEKEIISLLCEADPAYPEFSLIWYKKDIHKIEEKKQEEKAIEAVKVDPEQRKTEARAKLQHLLSQQKQLRKPREKKPNLREAEAVAAI